jgi:hypothetical protein
MVAYWNRPGSVLPRHMAGMGALLRSWKGERGGPALAIGLHLSTGSEKSRPERKVSVEVRPRKKIDINRLTVICKALRKRRKKPFQAMYA